MNVNPILGLAWNPTIGIPMLVVGAIVFALLWLFGQPRKEQGRRKPVQPVTGPGERREPVLGDDDMTGFDDGDPFAGPEPRQGELDVEMQAELERLGATLAGQRSSAPIDPFADFPSPSGARSTPVPPQEPKPIPPVAPPRAAEPPRPAPRSEVGRRPPNAPVERIVSLYVVARDNARFNGADLVVAAEKAGLEFGDMGIYHRLVDGRRELGPIFSVANLVKPGNFDLSRVDSTQTPGLSFFMALPGPIPALDAWDTMLPTAQRLAELLDGLVLDEERNALGRQRIAHIRDELRGWDRGHEGEEIKFGQ
jgi:cell division protein ZipA